MKTVNLLTGRTGDHTAEQIRIFDQLEKLPAGVDVIRGGGATLEDGYAHIFTSATGADNVAAAIDLRGVGA